MTTVHGGGVRCIRMPERNGLTVSAGMFILSFL